MSEALRLAIDLEWPGHIRPGTVEEAAVELRRLHAVNQELVEALEELAELMDDTVKNMYTPDSFTTQPARAALAKAGEQK